MPTIQLQVPQLIMRTITKHYTVNNIRQNKTIYNGPTDQFAYWFYKNSYKSSVIVQIILFSLIVFSTFQISTIDSSLYF